MPQCTHGLTRSCMKLIFGDYHQKYVNKKDDAARVENSHALWMTNVRSNYHNYNYCFLLFLNFSYVRGTVCYYCKAYLVATWLYNLSFLILGALGGGFGIFYVFTDHTSLLVMFFDTVDWNSALLCRSLTINFHNHPWTWSVQMEDYYIQLFDNFSVCQNLVGVLPPSPPPEFLRSKWVWDAVWETLIIFQKFSRGACPQISLYRDSSVLFQFTYWQDR